MGSTTLDKRHWNPFFMLVHFINVGEKEPPANLMRLARQESSANGSYRTE